MNKKTDAVRQARYADRMRAKGLRQRKFWLTDEENAALRERLAELRGRRAGLRDKLLEKKAQRYGNDTR